MIKETLNYLLGRIEEYEDKADNILQICLDAQLIYTLSLEYKHTSPEKKKVYAERLSELLDMMKTSTFGMSMYELDEYWSEIKGRSWRDRITFDGQHISKVAIKKYFLDTYQTIRYDLINAGFKSLKFGGSGDQPDLEGINEKGGE